MDLSLREAARILNVSESTLSRWVNEEGLSAVVINGRYRINRVDLLEWANQRKIDTTVLYAAAPESIALHALLEGNIHYGVAASDVNSAMAAVAQLLPLPSARDKALAAQALAEREASASTGIGDGIAIPHAQSPLVFPVERPMLALCFLARPIPFDAPDGKPVDVVWVLVSPTIRAHLALLARVASVLHDGKLRLLLAKRSPAPEILARVKELS
ncbi:MAG: PTS sugar transporter subunit IIA [Elusimicrobia bacterium]|nr:PTS sugar transporter subunit IIA [Elusimicrobiota bacterium]